MNLFNINGKKAIVTGGTRGLGNSMAEGLMEAGCEVCIIGSGRETVGKAVTEFADKGLTCKGIYGNLSIREEVHRAFHEALAELGGEIDILVVAHGIQRRHRAEEFPLSDWDDVINVNLNSVFILNQEAAKVMLPKGYGKIINITSMLAWQGGYTVPAYAASKGGVAQLTKALGNEWISKGVNVNALAPGYMATDMNEALLDHNNPRYQQITERIPAGRWGVPNDMKGPCLFLASHASDYLSGAIIPVDGGYLVR